MCVVLGKSWKSGQLTELMTMRKIPTKEGRAEKADRQFLAALDCECELITSHHRWLVSSVRILEG